MFGLFLEKLHMQFNKVVNPSEDTSILNPNTDAESPFSFGNEMNGSPKVVNKTLQHQDSQQKSLVFPATGSYHDQMEQRKLRNPSPIRSKQLDDDQDIIIDHKFEGKEDYFRSA